MELLGSFFEAAWFVKWWKKYKGNVSWGFFFLSFSITGTTDCALQTVHYMYGHKIRTFTALSHNQSNFGPVTVYDFSTRSSVPRQEGNKWRIEEVYRCLSLTMKQRGREGRVERYWKYGCEDLSRCLAVHRRQHQRGGNQWLQKAFSQLQLLPLIWETTLIGETVQYQYQEKENKKNNFQLYILL